MRRKTTETSYRHRDMPSQAAGLEATQVHSPKAITKRYNIAVTVTVSMSGGCIWPGGRSEGPFIHRFGKNLGHALASAEGG